MKKHLPPIIIFLVLASLMYGSLITTLVNGDDEQIIFGTYPGGRTPMIWSPSPSEFLDDYTSLWDDHGSHSTFYNTGKMPLVLPLSLLASLLHMGTTSMYIIMLVLVAFLSGICMYFCVYWLLRQDSRRYPPEILSIASTVAGIAYMWNPFVVSQFQHLYMRFSYALVPLMVILLLKGLKGDGKRYYVLCGLLWSVACGDLHWTVYGAFVIGFISLFHLAFEIRGKSWNMITQHVGALTLIGGSFFLFSMYWLLPSLITVSKSTYVPYIVTQESIDLLFQESIPLHVFNLTNEWRMLPYDPLLPIFDNTALAATVSILSLMLPAFALSALVLRPRNRNVITFAALGILIVVLSSGPNMIGESYYWLAMESPFSSMAGWIMRTSRIGQLFALTCSILFAYALVEILLKLEGFGRRHVNKATIIQVSLVTLLLLSIGLPAWPLATGDFNGKIKPTSIPSSFQETNAWLDEQEGNFRVLWLPHYLDESPHWNPDLLTTTFDIDYSAKPISYAFENQFLRNFFRYSTTLNYNHPSLLGQNRSSIGPLLAPFNVRYVVIHDDINEPRIHEQVRTATATLGKDDSFKLVKKASFISIFENKYWNGDALFNIPSTIALTTKGMTLVPSLSKAGSFDSGIPILFLEQNLDTTAVEYDYGQMVIMDAQGVIASFATLSGQGDLVSPFDFTQHHKPSIFWSKGGIYDPLHATWHLQLAARDLEDSWQFGYDTDVAFTDSSGQIKESVLLTDDLLLQSFQFESLDSWNQPLNPEFEISLDYEIAIEGNSLKITTASTKEKSWSGVVGPEIDVEPGIYYRIVTSMRQKNAEVSHINVMGWNTETEEWSLLTQVRPKQEAQDAWEEWSKDVLIPSQVNKVKLRLNAGWVSDPSLNNATTWFDNIRTYNVDRFREKNDISLRVTSHQDDDYVLLVRYYQNTKGGAIGIKLDDVLDEIVSTKSDVNGFVWYEVGKVELSKGNHRLILENVEGFNAVNVFLLISANEYETVKDTTLNWLDTKQVAYVLEAESELHSENAQRTAELGVKASNGEVLTGITQDEAGQNSQQALKGLIAWRQIEILKKANYMLGVRLKGNATVEIDDNTYYVNSDDLDFAYLPPIYLESGEHMLRISAIPDSESPVLDVVWLYEVEEEEQSVGELFESAGIPGNMIEYDKKSPTKYTVKVNATEPFMLSFAEAYDPLWVAKINGKEVESTPLYSAINGFWVEDTGEIEISIEYKPQRWFQWGAIVSLISLIGIGGYLVYSWRWGGSRKANKRFESRINQYAIRGLGSSELLGKHSKTWKLK